MKRTVAGLVASAALALAQTRPPDYAIAGARIVISPEQTISSGTIVVRNGLIDSISESAPPAEARVYDAKGLTVYPGLIDAASHYGFPAPAPRSSPLASAAAAAPSLPPTCHRCCLITGLNWPVRE